MSNKKGANKTYILYDVVCSMYYYELRHATENNVFHTRFDMAGCRHIEKRREKFFLFTILVEMCCKFQYKI